MHRARAARHARAGLTVYPPSRTLELLAFDEYCRFDTSGFFYSIKRAAKSSNVRDFFAAKYTVQQLLTRLASG